MRVIEQGTMGTIELREQEAGSQYSVLSSELSLDQDRQINVCIAANSAPVGQFGNRGPSKSSQTTKSTQCPKPIYARPLNLRRVPACKQSPQKLIIHFLGLSSCSNLDFNNYFDPHHFISFVWNSEPRASVCVSLLKKFW